MRGRVVGEGLGTRVVWEVVDPSLRTIFMAHCVTFDYLVATGKTGQTDIIMCTYW